MAIRLGAGCVLVGIVAAVVLLTGDDWRLFVLANGASAILLIILSRSSVLGADKRRPPGIARASAERWAGPIDPNELAARERALRPEDAAAESGAGEVSSGLWFLLVAVPPAAAASPAC